jgi:hypothetical protein
MKIEYVQSREEMNWKYKAAIATGAILLIAILLFIIKQQRDIISRQQYAEQSVVEMKKLRDDIVRAQANYATTKDVERIIKDSGADIAVIKDDLSKLGAEIKGVSTVVAERPKVHIVNLPSTNTTPGPETTTTIAECPDGSSVECPNPDKYGYLSNQQWLRLDEPFENKTVPLGDVGFSAWKEKPWELKLAERKYTVVNVLSTNDDGRHFVHSKFTVETDGKKYAVPISESKFVEVLPKPEFRFSPRLYMSVDLGVKANPPAHLELIPNLQLMMFSYGETAVNPEWTFLGLGIGYEAVENGISLVVSPINYNVGRHLPFVENIHLGPSVAIDPDGNFSVLLGLRVGL